MTRFRSCLAGLAALSIASLAWAPRVEAQLYSETFPKIGPEDAELATVGWDATSSAVARMFDHTGQNVSNEAATGDGVDQGVAFSFRGTNGTQAIWTMEFTPITPGAGGVDIIWFQTEDAAVPGSTIDVHAAVMVGSQWYASERAFTTNDTTNAWQRIVFPYTTTAANWRLLTLGAGNATIGAAPGANLAGNISGLGLVTVMTAAQIGGETVWYDYIEISNRLTPGDVNGVGGVTLADYDVIRANFRTAVTSRAQGDLNGDRFVDVLDFREWKANAPPAMGAGLTIPEPASYALAAVAALAAAARRRQRGVVTTT